LRSTRYIEDGLEWQGQIGAHDDQELINSRWITPAEALAAQARARTIIPVSPQPFDHPDGPALRIPAEAGYGVTEVLIRDIGD